MDAFDGDLEVKSKVFEAFRDLGIKIYEDLYLHDILADAEHNFEGLVLKPEKGDKFETVFAKILVTASVLDIEEHLFNSIQENGLVYNGRLIVKNTFKTEDPNIFACGKIVDLSEIILTHCLPYLGTIVEFSQMYKNYALGKSLRLDRFSGRELGQKLGQSVLEALGIMAPIAETDPRYEKLPSFEMPTGICAYLPGDLMYIRVTNLPEGVPKVANKSKSNRPEIVSNNLAKGNGHFLKIGFDNNGMIKSACYLGSEAILISSLVSLVGLSETYLNKLIERHEKLPGHNQALVENVTEFLSENWAMALYHQWFSEFRFSLKQKLADNTELQRLMRDITEEAMRKKDGYVTRDLMQAKLHEVPENFRQIIRVAKF